jgi:hypothetical protein
VVSEEEVSKIQTMGSSWEKGMGPKRKEAASRSLESGPQLTLARKQVLDLTTTRNCG